MAFKKETVLSKIDKTDSCWLWKGAKTYNGYGFFNWQDNGKAHGKMAHRVVYELLVGPIGTGLTLDHSCRNRICVNPSHLEPMTLGDNIRRSLRALSNTCKYGHEYKEQSAFYQKIGARRCHECHRAKAQLTRKERIAV